MIFCGCSLSPHGFTLIVINGCSIENILEINEEFCTEVRIFDNNEKYNPISKFINSYEDYNLILKEFNDKRWNMYCGVNRRSKKTKLMKEIENRKLFYFDVENFDKKPPYSDTKNYNELKKYTKFVINLLEDIYNLKLCTIITTGRGLSIYYKFVDIPIKLENNFKKYIKNIFKFIKNIHNNYNELDKYETLKKYKIYFEKEIFTKFKCWDSVIDSSRINGLIGSINTKYPEQPLREIIYLNTKYINDINNKLKNVNIT